MHLSHRDKRDLYVLLEDLLDILGEGLVPTDRTKACRRYLCELCALQFHLKALVPRTSA